jgi:PAS domain S-box-containing protein
MTKSNSNKRPSGSNCHESGQFDRSELSGSQPPDFIPDNSEQKYFNLVENSNDGIVVLQDGVLKFTNSVMLRMCGYSMDEVLNKPFLQHVTPEFQKAVIERHTARLKGESAVNKYEAELIASAGYVIPVELNSSLISYEGKPAVLTVIRDMTEHKEMERALRKSEGKYSSLIENSNDGFVVLQDHRIKFVNPAMIAMLGRSSEEIIGTAFTTYISPEFHEELENRYISRFQGKPVPDHFEAAFVHSDGRKIRVELNSSLFEYEGKLSVLTVVRNIDRRKQAETLLESLAEKSQVAFYIRRDRVFLYISPNFTKLFGFTLNDLTSTNFNGIIYPDDKDKMVEHLRQLKDDGISTPCQLRYVSKSGNLIWVIQSSVRIEYEGKLATLYIAMDISEQKRLEEDTILRAKLLDVARDGIVMTDRRGNIAYANAEAIKMSGYTDGPVENKNLFELVSPVIVDELRIKIQKLINGQSDATEIDFVRADGSTIPLDVRVQTLDINNTINNKEMLLVTIRDITENRKEKARRNELEQKALLNNRLATVGVMAAGIAHEINNPLTAVVGYSDLLLNSDIPAEIRGDVELINEGGKRAGHIVEGLLAFARQRKPQRKKVQINDIIKTTLDLQTYALKMSNVNIVTRLDPNLPMTVADPSQIQQVFLNLIVNAMAEIQKTGEGGTLGITTENEDDLIRISFKDSGPGIARENLDRIFDPFFTTKDVGEGTGLGLSISHGIISEHNGRIYVRSHKGKGATFVVELPVVSKSEQLAFEETSQELQSEKKARILVVDDESVIRTLITRVLENEGHEVNAVDSGEKALDLIKSNRYNLILLDIKMPGIGGIELYKRIKEIADSLANRIVFITGDVMGDDTQKFLMKTKAPYIMKPFDSAKLKIEISSLLDNN